MMDQLLQLANRGWRSAVEILLLTVGIYYGYLYFRGTRGAKVLTGLAIVFLTLTLISQLLNLVVIGWIIRSFSVFLAIALVVIFQPELRRGLAELGGHPIFSLTSEKRETVHDLVEAVTQLASKQFGALIALERDTSIRVYEELKRRHSLVRYMNYQGHGDGLRVSVGTDAEIDRLFDELKRILQEAPTS